jgi:hypothetical protein
MAKSYAMEESIGFLVEYMQGFILMGHQVWDVEEEGITKEVLKGAGISIDLGLAIWDIAHRYVLINTTTMVV